MRVYFPHEEVRPQQKTMMQDILDTISGEKTLLVNAPTGIGKTASSIAPALSYALANKKKVFFLTPKSSQHEIAIETANEMNRKFRLGIKTLDLVGKRKMCIHPFVSHTKQGFYEACFAARKNGQCIYYRNAKPKTTKEKREAEQKKQLVRHYGKSYEEMKNACTIHELCPYEITIEMMQKADLIVADYFHIFQDEIRQGLLGKTLLRDCILIIDEAHNTPHRIRDMLSITLKSEDVEKAAKEALELKNEELRQILLEIAAEIKGYGGKIPFGKQEHLLLEKDLGELKRVAKKHTLAIEETAVEYMKKKNQENSYLISCAEFLYFLAREKKNTLHITEQKRNSFRLSLYPLDPSEVTGKIINAAHSCILMSGTLVPQKMYEDILGIENCEAKEYESPFPKENRLNIFVDRTTTKYTERNSAQFDEIASIITGISREVPGNTIVFFPSFKILNEVSPRIKSGRQLLEQKREMGQDAKNKLVKKFKELGSGFGAVLLAVSGGSIAEGVDFPGENLKCAIIVGLPFEQVSIKSKELISFYDKKFGRGWDYAYNAPAINRAVQAAGRVIRTEKDKGVCVFLDKRFLTKQYEEFFPKEARRTISNEPEKLVKEFFS